MILTYENWLLIIESLRIAATSSNCYLNDKEAKKAIELMTQLEKGLKMW